MCLNVVVRVLFLSSYVRNLRARVRLCMGKLDLRLINISKEVHDPITLLTKRLAFF
jgi:hypothetical protein